MEFQAPFVTLSLEGDVANSKGGISGKDHKPPPRREKYYLQMFLMYPIKKPWNSKQFAFFYFK